MSVWKDWYAHIRGISGVVAGGIYTQAGAVCHDEKLGMTAQNIAALCSAFNSPTNVTVGGVKYQFLRKADDNCISLRGSGAPMSVYKTATLLLVAVGSDESAPASISTGLYSVWEQLEAS